MTETRWPDGCPRDGHLLDGICVMTKVEALAPPEPVKILSYHYGPTGTDPDPGATWCYGCGGRVWLGDGHAVCGCGAQVCESPVDCGDDNCEYRERGGAT